MKWKRPSDIREVLSDGVSIKVFCSHPGCKDYRLVDIGDLELLVKPDDLVDEVVFVCYRHQDELIEKGILSDNIASILVCIFARPGTGLKSRSGMSNQINFLKRHCLVESREEFVGKSTVHKKEAFYITESGRKLIAQFISGKRTVSFRSVWDPYRDVPDPWWQHVLREHY